VTLTWYDAGVVELREGYTVTGPDGAQVGRLTEVRVALQGGFLHIHVPGAEAVEIESAPAVSRVAYRP
jgi:hypothetical protein